MLYFICIKSKPSTHYINLHILLSLSFPISWKWRLYVLAYTPSNRIFKACKISKLLSFAEEIWWITTKERNGILMGSMLIFFPSRLFKRLYDISTSKGSKSEIISWTLTLSRVMYYSSLHPMLNTQQALNLYFCRKKVIPKMIYKG